MEHAIIEAPYSRSLIPVVGLKEIGVLLKRRFRTIAGTILGCMALTAIVLFFMPRTYSASTTLVLERTDVRPFETNQSLQSQQRDKSAAETEMDVLRSRQLAGRAVDALNLTADSRFNTYISDGGFDGAKPADLPDADSQRQRAISVFLSLLDVTRSGDSLAVTVEASFEDPKIAADVVNTLAKIYVDSSLEYKKSERAADKERARANEGAVGFLRERIAQPLLVALRTEESRVQQARSQLASVYGKKHPKIVEADAQLASLHRMIDEEVQRILSDLEEEATKPSARIISLAEVPAQPASPKTRLVMAGALAGSTLLGILLALLQEAVDTRIRNGERCMQLTGIPNLGYVPKLVKKNRGRERLSFLLKEPQSIYSEAMRLFYLGCRLPNSNSVYQTIVVTSCLELEGASSAALGLAVAAATDGSNTMLVDLDLHRGDLSKSIDFSYTAKSISNFLLGECSLEDVTQKCPDLPNLDFIALTQPVEMPSTLMNSKRLNELFESLRLKYDVIVVHLPPVLAVGDANWLAPIVDALVLTVAWEKTKEDVLMEAIAALRMFHAPLIGTLINEVDPSAQAGRRYGGTLSYYRVTQKYLGA